VSVTGLSGGGSSSGRRIGLLVKQVLAPVVLAAAWGCGHELPPAPPVPHDTTAPLVRIVYPPPDSGTLYDRDANGLMDLEVTWSDSGSRVDPASVRVTCAPDCLPGVAPDTNLAVGWRVVRRDTASLVLEETVALLLRDGPRTLSVTVRDTAGNVSAPAQASLALPPGAYHRSISLAGRPDCQPERGVNFAFSPDGRKGFAPYHFCVAVFDPDGVQPTHFIPAVPHVGWASQISVDTATGLAYIAGGGTPTTGFTVLDMRTEQVVADKLTSSDIASVVVDGDRIFAGESCTDGRIIVFDRRTLAEAGRIEVGAVSSTGACPNAESFAFSSDHGAGWVTIVEAGVVRFDPVGMRVLEYYDLEPGWPGYFGDSRQVELLRDHLLYIARIGRGLDLYEVAPWQLLASRSPSCCIVTLAVSPDRQSVVANQNWTGNPRNGDVPASTPQLYDVGADLTLRYAFPPRVGRITDAVRFHPDGKRFYVMAELQVDVYLVRSR